ncbi:DUF4255 domain-containing protein [Oscillatoria sp. FACHB-1406]|uniref:DUF4255 domain-containing protein n=1 Tax=Oscillatoria sp. FACHB-1406 TaxID=2692846 RepID=UPI001683FAA7|nr:DUF4255 domain-containing protein [Oscillatoria sp. FACHB-1406]MBD2576501.1 DUF4255 domain-containing protein [Oscillatoria sp. FACHB-1406]
MSNYLAIATVTAALQKLLLTGIQEDMPEANVTTVRPEVTAINNQGAGINIFLYQALPNPAWQNADLRTRRPKENLIKHGQAGLDLYYLLTFYGNEVELQPQRLLGAAIQTLVDRPILTQAMIREVLADRNFGFLGDSTLADQVQQVMFIPSIMTTEDLSRIWSVFFQIPYALSFAYQASAVLIQGKQLGKAPLPVRKTQFYVSPRLPAIEKVKVCRAEGKPMLLQQIGDRLQDYGSLTLRIEGKQLRGEPTTRVQLGDAQLTPQDVGENGVELIFSELTTAEKNALRAGVQKLQVIHPIPDGSFAPERAIESNAIAIVLCPKIESINLTHVEENEEGLYDASLTVRLDLMVGKQQRVFAILNSIQNDNPITYIFAAEQREIATLSLIFTIDNISLGEYLVRVQIDGAESNLEVEGDRYSGPFVSLQR